MPLFFGYGANRARSRIAYILGRDPGDYVGAVAEGFVLAVQYLSDIPEKPRSLFRELYGNDFIAYTLKNGNGVVLGLIWEITDGELEKIKEWEFVGLWRELIEIEVKSSGGKVVKVLTEKVVDKFPVNEVVDGLLYNEFDFVKQNRETNLLEKQYYTDEQIKKIKVWLKSQ